MTLLALLLGAIAFIVLCIVRLRVHPFLALLVTALGFGLAAGMPVMQVIESVSQGFGNTLGAVGPIIVVGVMIGALLEHSGGAFTLAERMLRWLGEKRVTWGMALMGFVTSIPVFGDSTFIILQSLNRALTKRAGLSLAVTSIALYAGLSASHVLVPPTPGPIAAAELLDADLGMVIGWGIAIGLVSLLPCLWFAHAVAARTWIDPAPQLDEGRIRELTSQAPSPGMAALPILVPIALIVGKSFNDYFGWLTEGTGHAVVSFLGTPVIALLVALAIALWLPRERSLSVLAVDGPVGEAIKSAAVIILVTGAGGIFGMMLRNSGVAAVLGEMLGDVPVGLWLPFIVAGAIRVAQGSATVAIITTAALMSPLLGDLGIDTEFGKVLAVLAIGAGSVIFSHANDSGFWVVTQLSGMTVAQGLRLVTVVSGILGFTAAVLVNLAWWLLG